MADPRDPAAGAGPLLSVRDVTLAFGPKVIQHDLSFDVRRGSIFAVMGGSGCGKSTVLKSMIGLLRPRAGKIFVEGEDYWGGAEVRRTEIGRRFGGRDHTTVLHAVRKIEALCANDGTLRDELDLLKRMLQE